MDFDQYANSYETEIERVAGVSVEGLAAEKARGIIEILSRMVGDPSRLHVLDLGCGIGLVDRHLQDHVGSLTGVDVSEKSIEIARTRASSTQFTHYDGANLPFDDESFDAVFVICVLLVVPPAKRRPLIDEMMRVLRPGGVAIVMEHNPYNPVTRLIVSRCALDVDSKLLTCQETLKLLQDSGAHEMGRRYFGFVPYRHRLVQWGERALFWLPAGAQYSAFGAKPAKSKAARPLASDARLAVSPAAPTDAAHVRRSMRVFSRWSATLRNLGSPGIAHREEPIVATQGSGNQLAVYWLALLFAVLISVVGETLLKAAAGLPSFARQLLDWRTLLGMVLYGAAALLYMLALRHIPLSVAMPCTAASYVAVALIGHFVFRETIGFSQVGGMSLIVLGVFLLTYGSF